MYAAHQFSALAAEPMTLREEASLPLPQSHSGRSGDQLYSVPNYPPQQQQQPQQPFQTGITASVHDRKFDGAGYAGSGTTGVPVLYDAGKGVGGCAVPFGNGNGPVAAAADTWSAQCSSFNVDMSGVGQQSAASGYAGQNVYPPSQQPQQQHQQHQQVVGGLSGGWTTTTPQSNTGSASRSRRNSARLPVGQISWQGPPPPMRSYGYPHQHQQHQQQHQQQQPHLPPPPTAQMSHSSSMSNPPQPMQHNNYSGSNGVHAGMARASSMVNVSPRKESLYGSHPPPLPHAQSFIEPRQLQQQQQYQQQQYQYSASAMRPAPVTVNPNQQYRYYLGNDDGSQGETQGLAASILSKVDSFGSKLADAFGLTAPANEQYGGATQFTNPANRPSYHSRGPNPPPTPGGMAPYGRSRSDIYPAHDPTALV